MAKAALIEHRPWLFASVIASIAYYFLSDNPFGPLLPAFGGVWLIALKGAGVAFLAAYALRRAHRADGKILALALALSAMADMALEIEFIIGGALFAASHAVAIVLYSRNRRENLSASQVLLSIALLIATPLVSYWLSGRIEIAAYALTLGLMASFAWSSRFPRYRVGLGAVLFVVSDWLIFSDMGPVNLGILPALLVWPLYYGGQLMIATGVVQTLRGETPVK